jgi:small subunit ribosomal protein S2
VDEKTEIETASAELKPGERKVISDGTKGPVVEIIKRSAGDDADGEAQATEAADE